MCARTLSASLFAERAKLPSKEWVALPECQRAFPKKGPGPPCQLFARSEQSGRTQATSATRAGARAMRQDAGAGSKPKRMASFALSLDLFGLHAPVFSCLPRSTDLDAGAQSGKLEKEKPRSARARFPRLASLAPSLNLCRRAEHGKRLSSVVLGSVLLGSFF